MTEPTGMPPTRRRPIPGMASNPIPPPPAPEPPEATSAPVPVPGATLAIEARPAVDGADEERMATESAVARPLRAARRTASVASANGTAAASRRPAADYATTRLVNFRLPADLHDRYKQLVREAEERHPRLRHPSLTELLIALLEEGHSSADEVAELIRRKRAAEHGAEP